MDLSAVGLIFARSGKRGGRVGVGGGDVDDDFEDATLDFGCADPPEASNTTTPVARISSTMATLAGSDQKSTNDCAKTGPMPSTWVSAPCARLSGPPRAAATHAFCNAASDS